MSYSNKENVLNVKVRNKKVKERKNKQEVLHEDGNGGKKIRKPNILRLKVFLFYIFSFLKDRSSF